jgi:hypothetical protein
LGDEQIGQLARAKIKFISGLALNRAMKRDKNFSLKESVEILEVVDEVISEAVDEVAARELTLYIENDPTLYRQRIKPIIKNLARKMKKGTFDATLAQKGFMYAVEHGLKNYNKEFGPGFNVDKDTKKKVAQDLLDGFMDEIEEAAS